MLKDIIKRCAYLLNRIDISDTLVDVDEIEEIDDSEVKHDVLKLIDFYNSVSSSVFENYLELDFCEKILSNSESKISFDRFSKTPIKVLKVETENKNKVGFDCGVFDIIVPEPKRLYDVTYMFVPDRVYELESSTDFLPEIYQDIICYAVISEFLASISKYSESTYWREKFTSEIFKLNSKKERRVKSTYCL